ncbi:MAG: glycosyltransferase family 2 protein [Pseudomonadota bacterium]
MTESAERSDLIVCETGVPGADIRDRPPAAKPSRRRSLITVLIPVFNEVDGLDRLLERLRPVLDALETDWRILFVDDGSRDATFARLKAIGADDTRVAALTFSRNFGKEIAIAAGLKHATGDAVIIMDADLQHPPEVLTEFVARWREGYEIVYGQRLSRENESPLRRLMARVFYRLFNSLVDTDIPKGAGDFRLLCRRAVDAMNQINETSRFNKGLFSWIGFKAIGVPFTVEDRQTGFSKWSLRRLTSFALDGLTSFSTLPLRVWSLVGAAVSLISMVYAVIILTRTLVFGADVPGFPSLIISVMFFSGIQLISLGVIGEYLGRVYEEVKARPLYIVADSFGLDQPKDATMAAGSVDAHDPGPPSTGAQS